MCQEEKKRDIFIIIKTIFLHNPHKRQEFSSLFFFSSIRKQKPWDRYPRQKPRWQILDQRCNLKSLEKCGIKNACSVVVFFVLFFFSLFSFLRNFTPGNQTILLPRQSWQRGHWSSMFPLKFLPTVLKSRRLRCRNEILVVDDCSITYAVLQLLSQSFRWS